MRIGKVEIRGVVTGWGRWGGVGWSGVGGGDGMALGGEEWGREVGMEWRWVGAVGAVG